MKTPASHLDGGERRGSLDSLTADTTEDVGPPFTPSHTLPHGYSRLSPVLGHALHVPPVIMMSSSDSEPSTGGPLKPVMDQYYKTMRQYQILLDRVTPFVLYRWLSTAGLVAVFLLRIVLAQGVRVFGMFKARSID